MRIRTVLLVLATVAVVLFALLNWGEITRPTALNLGWQTVTAPLGLVLLGVLAIAAFAFLAVSASSHTRHLMETRQHAKSLQAQRDLADRAEASRFTDLRQQVETHLRESRQREATHASELDQALARHLRELRTQIQELQRSLSMRLGELESGLLGSGSRMEHDRLRPAAAAPIPEPIRETVREPTRARVEAQPPREVERAPTERVDARRGYYRGEPVRDEPVMGQPTAADELQRREQERAQRQESAHPEPYNRGR